MDNTEMKQIEIETSILYIMSIAMDLIMRDCEKRMSKNRTVWKKEKKAKFLDYMRHVRVCCQINDTLTQDIYDADKKNKYKNVDMWFRDGNEMARLLLLFADHSTDQDSVDKIFKTLRELKGCGIVTEEMLNKFYLQ